MEHAVEVRGDAALAHHVAHEHKEGHGDQRVPVEHLEGLIERHLHGAAAPEPERGCRADKADDAKDALPGKQQHHHGGEHEEGDEFGCHVIGLSIACATSRNNCAMTCRSIRKMPMVMATLTGQSTGDQAEEFFWLY